MKLIVGLGNPGEKYEDTRHNLGFRVVEKFLRDFTTAKNTVWENNDKLKSYTAVLENIILAKPKTYMNNSGAAVSLLAAYYKVDPADIWILHDELDLPCGSLKIRNGGSSAGHHGVQSVMDNLKTEKFWRFRLGIGESHNHQEIAGQKMHDVEEYVVSTFSEHQVGKVRELIKHASKALQCALEQDLVSAMNKYNTK